MRKAIQREADQLDAVSTLYGMGSFFRGEANYRDIDLVVVIDCPRNELMAKGGCVRTAFGVLGDKLEVIFDLTILTPGEFAERPLRDIDRLELLYSASPSGLSFREFQQE